MLKISIITIALMLMMTKKTQAGEESLYDFLWLDPDKKVYVLQNKLYKKEKSFYLDVGYAANLTSKFQDTRGYSARLGYYIHEEWGLELFYNQYSNSNNDDFRNVQLINTAAPFVRRPKSTYGAAVIWSPFYGKINTFNQIYYFDWSFGVGVAQVNTESNIRSVIVSNAPNRYENETQTGAVLKTKITFHLKENVHFGVEYMNTYYRAAGPKNPDNDLLRTNSDIVMSIGFSY